MRWMIGMDGSGRDGIEVVTKRDCEVIKYTRSRVKNYSKLTNLMKISRLDGYIGK